MPENGDAEELEHERQMLEEEQKAKIFPRTHVDVQKVLAVVKKKAEVKALSNGFFRYICFLAIYVTAVVLQRDATTAQSLQHAVQQYLLGGYRDAETTETRNFYSIHTTRHFWEWHENFVQNMIFVQSYNNGEPRTGRSNNMILTHNRLCSGFRMVQRRGVREICGFENKDFLVFSEECTKRTYLDGRAGAVSKEPFMGADGETEYIYEELEAGIPGAYAKDVGFFQNFDNNKEEAIRKMRELRDNRWINAGTQWYRLDFVLYNPNVGLFCAVSMKLEFDNTGVVIPEIETETMSGTINSTWTDQVRLFLEIITVIFWAIYVITYTRRAIAVAKEQKKTFAFFHKRGHIVVFVQLILFFVIIVMWAMISNNPIRSNLVVTEDAIRLNNGLPANFTGLTVITGVYFIVNGLNVLLSLIRTLGFMRVNSNLSQLTDTINLMLGDLQQFAVILLTLLLAFMLMSHTMFGTTLEDFAILSNSAINTFEHLLGRGNYFQLAEADPIAAPIFFFPFVFIMIFVVLNITIAIIMDGYNAMQSKRKDLAQGNLKDRVELSFTTQFKNGCLRLLSPFKDIMPASWRKIETEYGVTLDRFSAPTVKEVLDLLGDYVEDAEDHGEQAKYVTIEEVKRKLHHKQTTPERIEAVFDRYGGWVDPEQLKQAKKSMSDLTHPTLKKLQEIISKVKKDQREIEGKVEMILKTFPN
mmetsp:Transcript_54129/g.110435  ORF Transcript_54129/g.110435 Transcript_54129/m.110435 type:complete len:699 (-) Transcript_54129:95-2191(-)|eukprot:CAMPEP_0181308064 /NCGR_PEP_ID=MMETSP1101-20121128/11241_1 /TAXON_ID=46948 /ORGANISM="Rhodomonas abbreviata, Strain Caron Lab Isolate" /LENGTH=698 /DNA_ID=CAMNT_0023414377 /DNA_START=147 /DNA_END=2243 /DNA_ORIENTATION=-